MKTSINTKFKYISGIYFIRNIKNNKVYIGSSNNLWKRYLDHCWLLRTNKHHSIHLQHAYTIDGVDSFVFEIFDINLSIDEIKHREPILIKLFQSYNDRFGYNILMEYKGTCGIKFTNDRCTNISNALKGRVAHNKGQKMTNDQKSKLIEVNIKKRGKKIDVYDLDGNFIKTEPSISTICKIDGIDKKSLQRVLKGEYKQFKGYVYKYHKNVARNYSDIIIEEDELLETLTCNDDGNQQGS